MTSQDIKTPAGRDIVESLAINLKLSEDLLSAIEEECAALRAMDTQGLFRICRHKETLLAKIHYLDDLLLQSWKEQEKTQTHETTSSEDMRLIGQYKQRINTARQEIKTRNMVNKRFTEDTLSCLGEAIALLTRPTQGENTYRIPGRSQNRGRALPNVISCEA